MTKTKKIIVAALAATGIAVAGGSALAYQGNCNPGGGGMGGPMGSAMSGPMMGDPGPRYEKMKARMEARQAQLHADLKLTAQQEPAWKTFTEKSMPRTDFPRPDPEAMAKMTAPERMEKMLEMSKLHVAMQTDRLEAMKTFYAVLTPEQQKIFDGHFMGPKGPKGGQGGPGPR